MSGRFKNGNRITQRASHRFINEDGLPGFQAGKYLFQMWAAVVGFQQNAIDLLQQIVDAGDDLHALFFHSSGVLWDTLDA